MYTTRVAAPNKRQILGMSAQEQRGGEAVLASALTERIAFGHKHNMPLNLCVANEVSVLLQALQLYIDTRMHIFDQIPNEGMVPASPPPIPPVAPKGRYTRRTKKGARKSK